MPQKAGGDPVIYDLHEVDRQLQSDAPGAISAWERHYSDQIAQVAVQLLLARINNCPVKSVVLPVSIANGTTA